MTDFAQASNYYDVLGVERAAPLHVIRSSYRRLMQRDGHHPDLGGDAATAALINKAYAVLSNAERRSAYDAELGAVVHGEGQADRDACASAGQTPPVRVLDPRRECVFCESAHDGRVTDVRCAICASPLTPVERTSWSLVDQRAMFRVGKRLEVNFHTDWRQRRVYSGYTEDVSPQGIRLITKHGLRRGQRVRIVSDLVDAVGQVTRCVTQRRGFRIEYAIGVSFVTLKLLQSRGGFVSQRV